MKPNIGNIAQQIQQNAQQEVQKTVATAFEQVSGAQSSSSTPVPVENASSVSIDTGAHVEELKRQEQSKLAELRSRLDAEIQQARQHRQNTAEEYVQRIDGQMMGAKVQGNEQQGAPEVPTSIQRGPAAIQSKKGTKEMGKMKG